MANFKVGDTVRIKSEVRKRRGDTGRRKTAEIESFYSDVVGGVRLTEKIDGFVSWNTNDLERAKAILAEVGE